MIGILFHKFSKWFYVSSNELSWRLTYYEIKQLLLEVQKLTKAKEVPNVPTDLDMDGPVIIAD